MSDDDLLAGIRMTNSSEHPRANAANRRRNASMHRDAAEEQRRLRMKLDGADMTGQTADAARASHERAERKHNNHAEVHDQAACGYDEAEQIYAQHERDQKRICAETDKRVHEIEQSKMPAAAKKAAIEAVKAEARAELLAKHTQACTDMDAMAARTTARCTKLSNPAGVTSPSSTTTSNGAASGAAAPGGTASGGEMSSTAGTGAPGATSSASPAMSAGAVSQQGAASGAAAGISPSSGTGAPSAIAANAPSQMSVAPTATPAGLSNSGPGAPGALPGGAGSVPASPRVPSAVPAASAPSVPSAPSAPSIPSASAPSMPSVPSGPVSPGAGIGSAGGSALAPSNLAGGFQSGLASGMPTSIQSNAAAGAGMFNASPATMAGPTAMSAPVFASPTAHVAPVMDASPAPMAEHSAAPAYVAPVMQATPAMAPMSPGAPPMPEGPMPAYGSDLRVTQTPPAVSSPPASAPPVAAAGGGAAAPATSAASGLGQPALVRQASPASAGAHAGATASASVSSQAAANVALSQTAAAAAGLAVGRAAEVTEEQRRCYEIVDAVAAQDNSICWAAGVRPDGTAILVTDVAGGWIPPGIRIPQDVELIQPADYRPGRKLLELLGDTEFQADFGPGQKATGQTQLELSDWPRQVEPVRGLLYNLRQATEWRDRMPAIALTLARALASRGSGLPPEIEELQKQLAAQRAKVLEGYRFDSVDMHAAGNWMLLSALDAAVSHRDSLLAAYHFSWFDATQRVE